MYKSLRYLDTSSYNICSWWIHAYIDYKYSRKNRVVPRGRPKTTYLQVIQTQLKEKHVQTLEDAMIEAKDRER